MMKDGGGSIMLWGVAFKAGMRMLVKDDGRIDEAKYTKETC